MRNASAPILFHREIAMPAKVRDMKEISFTLRPTAHAENAARNDRYGKLTIPASIRFAGKDIVEAEMTGGAVTKLVVRIPYDSTRDAIYVILPNGTLKTVWFNLSNDLHKTLDKSRYAARA